MRLRLLGSVLAASVLAGSVTAQTPPAPPAGPITAESLDTGLVNLGLMAGHAYQCLPEGERQVAQQRLMLFNSILVAQMGSNAAFRFASSFGAGSSHEVDRGFCERSLADWRRLVQEHRLDR